MTKSELRKLYRAKRVDLPLEELDAMSHQIADRFFAENDLSSLRVLHSFLPIVKFREVDTTLILHRIWREYPGIQTVVPRVEPITGALHTLLYTRRTELIESNWGVPEPVHDDAVPENEIDLVLVPLLAFDLAGHRVGYGRGFYDRLLGRCRPDCRKLGLSFFDPVDQIDDTHAGDVTLDTCVTPSRLYEFSPPAQAS